MLVIVINSGMLKVIKKKYFEKKLNIYKRINMFALLFIHLKKVY